MNKMISIRVDYKTAGIIDAIAEEYNVSRTAVIKSAIADYISRLAEFLEESAKATLEHENAISQAQEDK